MGVTIYPAGHEANAFEPENKNGMTEQDALTALTRNHDTEVQTRLPSFVSSSDLEPKPDMRKYYNYVISSSFPDGLPEGCDIKGNGFVQACIEAYSRHEHLVIRPDDVWLATLTQFSFYVNGNAEMLRDVFVEFEGKKELTIYYTTPDPKDVDWEDFAAQITKKARQHLRDPEFGDWIMAKFSTTTKIDETAASVAMMASMQSYFVYHAQLRRGLPSFTLLGNREDWYRILGRLSKLRDPSYGPETAQFADLLAPIIRRFIASFDNPKAPEIVDFWNRIFTRDPLQSGPHIWSGWIAAFTFWDKEGKKIKRRKAGRSGQLVLDGVVYESITNEDLSPGFSIVPIKITHPDFTETSATMLAGSTAVQAKSGGGGSEDTGKGGAVDSDETSEETSEGERNEEENSEEKTSKENTGKEKTSEEKTTEKKTSEEKIREKETGEEKANELKGPYDTRQPVVGWWLYKKAKVLMRSDENDSAGRVVADSSPHGGQSFGQ